MLPGYRALALAIVRCACTARSSSRLGQVNSLGLSKIGCGYLCISLSHKTAKDRRDAASLE